MSSCGIASSFTGQQGACDCIFLGDDIVSRKISLTLAAAPVGGMVKAGTIVAQTASLPWPGTFAAPAALGDIDDVGKRPVVISCDIEVPVGTTYPATVEADALFEADVNTNLLIFPAAFSLSDVADTKRILDMHDLHPIDVMPAPFA